MKSRIHVLVPLSTTAFGLREHFLQLLEPHRISDVNRLGRGGRFDYHYQPDGDQATLNCTATEAELPHAVKRVFSGCVSTVARLRPDVSAAAVVTPNGGWHDVSDFGWTMVKHFSADAKERQVNAIAQQRWAQRYRELLTDHPDCWVIERCVHS